MSGLFALGMIIFPTSMYSGKVAKVGMFLIDDNISEYLHSTFAALFLLSLSFFSIFLFTKRGPGALGKEKRRRNVIYRSCGTIMILTIVCIIVFMIFLRNTSIAKTNPVLVLECIALLAFGTSWLIKGNTLFKDKRD